MLHNLNLNSYHTGSNRRQLTAFIVLLFCHFLTRRPLSAQRIGDYVELVGLKSNGHHLNHLDPLTVSYACSSLSGPKAKADDAKMIGLELLLQDDDYPNNDAIVFKRIWNCTRPSSPNSKRSLDSQFQIVPVELPYELRYRPDLLLKTYFHHSSALIRVWMIDFTNYAKMTYLNMNNSIFDHASIKKVLRVQLTSPYSRPSLVESACLNYFVQFLYLDELRQIFKCNHEKEVVHPVTFPLALTGSIYGKIIQLKSYQDYALENRRLSEFKKFKFSVVVWLYIDDYCEHRFCGILQRVDFDTKRYSPNIFVTDTGQILVEVYTVDNVPDGALTLKNIPLHEWCRLVFHFTSKKWSLYMNCKSNFNQTYHAEHEYSSEIVYNDVKPLTIVGGNDMTESFRGFIGMLSIHRRQIVDPDELAPIPDDHVMFQLDLKHDAHVCRAHLFNVRNFVFKIKQFIQLRSLKDKSIALKLEHTFVNKKQDEEWCSVLDAKNRRINAKHFKTKLDRDMFRHLRVIIRREKWSFKGENETSEEWLDSLGVELYRNTFINELTENGFENVKYLLEVLRVSSCFGHGLSSMVLSLFYQHGVGIEANESLSRLYLMKAALKQDRVALLTLAQKHARGVDSIPVDYDQSYAYYAQMAAVAKVEVYNPIEDENHPYFARLTEKSDLESITDESGDLFNWLKDQAKKGVSSAQIQLANLLYLGTQGIKRNIEAVYRLYKMGAESKDPDATFNYGLSLLKGIGTEQNIELGRENLELSARLGHSTAFAALGYHAYDMEKNISKATDYWLEGWTKMKDVDCAFNLGFLWSEGLFGKEKKDLHKAWEYWSYAAMHGQIDAQERVAEFNAHGYDVIIRDAKLATVWAKYVAEQSSIIGKCLHEGILAYRNKNWPLSIFYYMLAASTGIEIGSFNLAYLCESNPEQLVGKYVQQECVWKYYNQSVFADKDTAHSYSLNKMGDYHLNKGLQNRTIKDPIGNYNPDLYAAFLYYATAYLRGEPQGLFNLALLIEDGYEIPSRVWNLIGLSGSGDSSSQLMAIYEKCTNDEHHSESYIPCMIALYKVKFNQHLFAIKITLIGLLSILVAVFLPRLLMNNQLFITI